RLPPVLTHLRGQADSPPRFDSRQPALQRSSAPDGGSCIVGRPGYEGARSESGTIGRTPRGSPRLSGAVSEGLRNRRERRGRRPSDCRLRENDSLGDVLLLWVQGGGGARGCAGSKGGLLPETLVLC